MSKALLLLPLVLLGVACHAHADAPRPASATATQASHCLQQHVGKLNTLLTKDKVAPYAKTAKVKVDYDKQSLHTITYSWPSHRTRTIAMQNMTMQIPEDNRIGLGGIKVYQSSDYLTGEQGHPVKVFKRYHHNQSKQEKTRARAAINAQMKKQGKEAGKAGGALLGGVGSHMKFAPVAGVGNAAAWDYPAQALDVLSGDTEFKVIVDISADPARNRAVAKKLAQSVLTACATQ